jgi:hypothetical protein
MRLERTQREIQHDDHILLVDVAYTVQDNEDRDPDITYNTLSVEIVVAPDGSSKAVCGVNEGYNLMAWGKLDEIHASILDYERERSLW